MTFKAELMDAVAVERALKRISHEIIEKNHGVDNVCLVGICRRGVPLAEKIAENIATIEGREVPFGQLDITLYRDDITTVMPDPVVNDTKISFDINGRDIILVDDVIYTGRTVRAAIDALINIGRPATVQLAELIDRGHREFPIRPDFVGKNIPTSKNELIAVKVPQFDGKTCVELHGIDD